MVIRICFLFVIGYDIGCVSEARMNVAGCMEEKIKNGIQYLRYVGPAHLDDNSQPSPCMAGEYHPNVVCKDLAVLLPVVKPVSPHYTE